MIIQTIAPIIQPVGIDFFIYSLEDTFVYPKPQATHDCVISKCCGAIVVVANSGNKKATGIVGFTAKTTARMAEPEPTKLKGPRKNPSGVNIANAIAKTKGVFGIKSPKIAEK